ncbi:MAG: mechanosensitive ion channel family protein [Thermoplasmata archaeon]
MSSKLFCMSVLGIFFLALFSMNALAADQIGSSDLYAFPVGDMDLEIHLDEELVYVWSICNTGTERYHVSTSVDNPDDSFDATVSPTHLDFLSDQSDEGCKDVTLTVRAPVTGDEGTVMIGVAFSTTNLSTFALSNETLFTTNRLTGITRPDNPEGKIMGYFENFMPSPLDTPFWAFIVTFLIWLGISALIVGLANLIARVFARETETKVDDMIVELMKGPIFLLIIFFGFQYSMPVGGIDSSQIPYLDSIFGMMLTGLLTWIVYKVFKDILVYYGTILSARTQTDLDDRLIPVISKLGGLMIVVFGVIAIFGSFGFDIALFLAGMGFLGIVIGFAARSTLSNFFAGIFLMLDRPFKPGDLIVIGSGEVCRVAWVGLRSTKLYHVASHQMITLPNNMLAEEKVVNITQPDERFRTKVEIGVAYGTDLDHLKNTLLDIVNNHPDVLKGKDTKISFRVLEFADSSINVKVVFWVNKVENKWRVESEVKELIDKRFKAENIEIPFPQRVVYMHQETKM